MNRNSESLELLLQAFALLNDPEEAGAFLEDLCTITEINDMAQRLQTAVSLSRGENYQTISKKVGISTATISRVARCMNYGSGGYPSMLEKLKEKGLLENGSEKE